MSFATRSISRCQWEEMGKAGDAVKKEAIVEEKSTLSAKQEKSKAEPQEIKVNLLLYFVTIAVFFIKLIEMSATIKSITSFVVYVILWEL